MAKVMNNPIMEGISGKIGKRLVFRQLRDGRRIVVTRPDFSNRVFSTGQLTHQSRFQKASAYAKVEAKTQPLYAQLAQQTPAASLQPRPLRLVSPSHHPWNHAAGWVYLR